ncbi:MAG: transcriptional repressor [Betaproteobacteria bacterium]|nr:transcriptional repressor [Betaproteobacteria bacterium]
MSHHDIEARLGDGALDRVTVYRVLDWLVASGLAHRTVDETRVSRFSAATGDRAAHRLHAHFHCDACRRVFCLEDAQALMPALPPGFCASAVEVSVRGRCRDCAGEGASHGA